MINKVLLVVNSDIGRGNSIGFRFGKLALELKKQDKEFNIIARANYDRDLKVKIPFYKNYLARFFNALRIYFFPKLRYREFEIGLFDMFVLRYLKKNFKKYDVVHFGEGLPRCIKFLKEKGIKVFLDIPIGHVAYAMEMRDKNIKIGVEKLCLSKTLDTSIELSDVLIIPSEFVKHTLDVAGFKSKKTEVVSFGADIESAFNKDSIKEKLKTQKITFLFAGNVNYRKGIVYLLKAWKDAGLKNAELIICGRVFKEIKDEIAKYDFSNVVFPGFVNIKEYMKKTHVFVFPSLLEGSSKAVYEAMSFGMPVITTFNAGSIVEDGKSGFIIPIANSEVLSEKIKYLNNKDLILEMGDSAFDKVKDYTWDNYAKKVVSIYSK